MTADQPTRVTGDAPPIPPVPSALRQGYIDPLEDNTATIAATERIVHEARRVVGAQVESKREDGWAWASDSLQTALRDLDRARATLARLRPWQGRTARHRETDDVRVVKINWDGVVLRPVVPMSVGHGAALVVDDLDFERAAAWLDGCDRLA